MMRAGSYIIFFIQFGDTIQTARQLPNAVVAKFFDKSELLLINSVCYFMRYRVIYFQCLCYLGLQCFDAVGWAAGRASGL